VRKAKCSLHPASDRRDSEADVEKHSVRASQLSTARKQSAPAPPEDPDDSLVCGRYRLGRCLGAGAFGTVWRARDERLDRDVAVKVVPRERVEDARFAREARAAARLSHPAVVTLYEAAADEDAAYLISELVRGPTLDKLLEGGRLSDRDIVGIGIALCDALDHAHKSGVIHRDVKPSNILVPARPTSSAHPAKLTDFGIAQVVGGDALTETGGVLGTDAYMAPEQAAGRPTGPQADVYALALVLYEALTGINPVAGIRRSRRAGAHLPPLRRQRRDLPRELGRGIDLALRPRPSERGTIIELRSALSSAMDELSDVRGVVDAPWRPRASRQPSHTEPAPTRHAQDAPDDRAQVVPSAVPRWPERAVAGAMAALLAGWVSAHALGASALTPATIGLLAAGLVLMLPRLGFAITVALLVAGAALGGHAGAALLIALAALIPVALLPRDGAAWPVTAGAPLLGLLGLAGAWPALAARGTSMWRRAGLAAAGWLWLGLVAPLVGSGLYVSPRGMPATNLWTGSLYETVHHVLVPALSAGVLLATPVWAAAAIFLPSLVGARSLAVDALRVLAWSGLVVAGTEIALHIGRGVNSVAPHTAIIGAAVGALVALGPSLLAAWRIQPRSEVSRAGLP
jgi:hypothetical protein